MIYKTKTIGLLLLLAVSNIAKGQTDREIAHEKGKKAVVLMDNGRFDESIKLLKEAQKLDPENIDYPYEIGYAYYAKKDHKKAIKVLNSLLNHKDVTDRVFQLLGNAYDDLGKSDKAFDTYEAGLTQFPNSGNIYLELGILQMRKKEYSNALYYLEKGIEVEPSFPSNYYWASVIYQSSPEEVWGMIYGEIFMNLERNSKRTANMSGLLYNTYKSEIKFTSDSSITVSFSKNADLNSRLLLDSGVLKLPFGIGIYEPTLMFSMLGVKSIDIHSLDKIRSNFVENYFKNGHDKTHPNVLFSYQKQIKDAGHMEAYNHWILMKGNEDGFEEWKSANKEKWDNFITWFSNNKIQIDDTNKFYREQY